MELPLAHPIMSRDATLQKDSKLFNCYWEMNARGKTNVVKRAGYSVHAVLPVGTVQDVFAQDLFSYAVIGDSLYDLFGANFWQALPSPGTPGLRMSSLDETQLSSGNKLTILKSGVALWKVLGTATKNVSAGYPTATVPGIAYLDGTFYVMSTVGAINGSALEDPLTWNALNFISVDRGIGFPVALSRHLNYIAAFCDQGIQFFYNAANPAPGSPLLPSGNTLTSVGCAAGYSIQNLDGATFFISKAKGRGRSVSVLNGMAVEKISTPAIDRVLAASDFASLYTMVFKQGGHAFYLITMIDLNITLAFDITTKDWAQWGTASTFNPADFSNNYWKPVYYLNPGNQTAGTNFLVPLNGGAYFQQVETDYTDYNYQIEAVIRTPILDHQNVKRKRLASVDLIADTANTTVSLSYSDDDYTTYSTRRDIDMSTSRKRLTRLGSFFRRSFELRHYDSTPLRIEGMVLEGEGTDIGGPVEG